MLEVLVTLSCLTVGIVGYKLLNRARANGSLSTSAFVFIVTLSFIGLAQVIVDALGKLGGSIVIQ